MRHDADPARITNRINRVRLLGDSKCHLWEQQEAAAIAQSVLHDLAGRSHSLMPMLDDAIKTGDWVKLVAACKAFVHLYDEGVLPSPRLQIAHEIEGQVLDIAEEQVKNSERTQDPTVRLSCLAIAAFLAGAALEDGLRRLCDAGGIAVPPNSTIAKLQNLLYQPSNNIEVISQSETKQITAWAATRNAADHGKFAELTTTEVVTMVMGVRAFLDKHLP